MATKRTTKKKAARKKAKRKPARPTPPAKTSPAAAEIAAYEQHRERAAQRQAKQSQAGRDIGELPAVADPKRRAKAEQDFPFFCRTYGAHVFSLPWAEPHVEAAERIEIVVLRGGRFAIAMPRGWGKTSLCQWAVIWATLYGHRRYPVYIGANKGEAIARLDEIKTEFETNDLLAADFPEVCFPIRALEGITQRARGQTYKGERTHIKWKGPRIVLPTIPGSPASGAEIEARGITGAIRGMKDTTAAGEVIRPDMAVPDDPQDDKSAASHN